MRFEDLEENFKGVMNKTEKFMDDHKDLIITLAPLVMMEILRSNRRKRTIKIERRNAYEQARRAYDPSLGIYVPLKRPLNKKEIMLLAEARKRGIGVAEYLGIMGLIK